MIDPRIREEAALWMARARDPRFADWDGLTAWLERDPAHNMAYEEAFTAHDLAGALSDAPVGSPVESLVAGRGSAPVTHRSVRRRWLAGGVLGSAAAATALVVLYPHVSRQPNATAIEVPPGHRRSLRLEDGTQIALNGGSRILLYPASERKVMLERGEAMFEVAHDARRPFTVDVGSARLVDLGTRFDVTRAVARTEVAVAEGAVLYDPTGGAVRLGPGEMLSRKEGSQVVEIAKVDPGAVGGWRTGTLVYNGAPLSRVAEDLERATGWTMEVDRSAVDRSYSGTIRIGGGDKEQLARRLASLLNLQVASRPHGLYLKARESR